jgi:hypothetical protein
MIKSSVEFLTDVILAQDSYDTFWLIICSGLLDFIMH